METKLRKTPVDLTDLAIGIIILGIVTSIGSLIVLNVRDNRLTSLATGTITNETVSSVDETGEWLAQTWAQTLTRCNNATGVIDSSNYTFTVSDLGVGRIVSTGDVINNGTDFKCTYSFYNTSRADFALPHEAAMGLAEYGNWFKIIVIVGVAAVILSLIFMAFGRGPQAGGGVAAGGGVVGGSY